MELVIVLMCGKQHFYYGSLYQEHSDHPLFFCP